MLINDRHATRLARIEFPPRRDPFIREIRSASIAVHRRPSSSVPPRPLYLSRRSLFEEGTAGVQLLPPSTSINLDLGSSLLPPSDERSFFSARVYTVVSASAKGRAHNYSSGSLPNSSSLITASPPFLRVNALAATIDRNLFIRFQRIPRIPPV